MNGKAAKTVFTTAALILILVVNSILYVLIWRKIRSQVQILRQSMTMMTTSMSASHRAARAMSLFVAAFFIQWWSMVVFGIWDLTGNVVPQPVVHLVTIFTNLGGVLNLIVLLLIRRGQFSEECNNKISDGSCVGKSTHVSTVNESKVV